MPEPVKTINDQWKEVAERLKLHLPNIPEVQRREMKRAFFMGFTACLASLKDVMGIRDEDDQVRRLERFHQEARGFSIAVQEGRA